MEPDANLDLSTSSDSEIPVNLPLPHLEDSVEFSSRMEVSPLENDSDVNGASDGEDESNEDDSIVGEDERTLAALGSSRG